jgi:ubiquinone/menaquinone biosynthesis C-methylase UbiE
MSVKHELFRTFDAAYEDVAPWDIDHPQAVYAELAQNGEIKGSVLDVGCGTGENTLLFAQLGHEVWGVDFSPLAIQRAQEKASSLGLQATFQVGDALELQKLGRTFDTVIDCGLLHNFSDEERTLFVESLKSVLRPGGKYFLHCFSEQLPHGAGPRGITTEEIYATFGEGWQVNSIRPTHFELTITKYQPPAWIADITYQPAD